MKSNLISKRETAALLRAVATRWNIEFPKIKNLKVHHVASDARLITGNGVKILEMDKEYLPFLSDTELLEKFPHVVVDMGAVKFMCNGANVMRPGIKSYSEFEEGSIVCVIEESKRKFLAVGKALVPSSMLGTMKNGEVLKNMHYISDKFWDAAKAIHD